jgi:hypothetical protein
LDGGVVTAPVTVRERDLRALAGIVREDHPDVPDGLGLPLSLLAELMGQIRCDTIAFQGFDCQRQKTWFERAGDVRIAVSQRLGERAGDLAQQEQPVKNGIAQHRSSSH